MFIKCAMGRAAALLILLCAAALCSVSGAGAEDHPGWSTIRPGLRTAKYQLSPSGSMIKSEVVLLDIDLSLFTLQLSLASDAGALRSDVKTLVRRLGGVAGINANFFDERNQPLGLVLRGSHVIQRLQSGGNLLTGVFYVADGTAAVVHRQDFEQEAKLSIAFQAGPRLIVNREPVKLTALQGASRRSGIAVTEDGNVLIFATLVRFPGATLEEIQKMLLDPQLRVKDALNLDGGGSSQLFVEAAGDLANEVNIGGGDLVPVALVVRERPSQRQSNPK